jgi:hypothetical protein
MTATLGCIYSRRTTQTSTGNPKVYWETTFNGELITAPSLKKCRELVAIKHAQSIDFMAEFFPIN